LSIGHNEDIGGFDVTVDNTFPGGWMDEMARKKRRKRGGRWGV